MISGSSIQDGVESDVFITARTCADTCLSISANFNYGHDSGANRIDAICTSVNYVVAFISWL